MRKLLIAATALGVCVAASPAGATVTVLDFTAATCSGGVPCTTGGAIEQSYGDGAGIDVGYATYTFTGNPTELALKYWALGYGDLDGVIWGGTNQTDYFSRITLTALPGYEISLISFDIATYLDNSALSPVLIESLGGTGIFADNIATLYPSHNHVAVSSAYFSDGIVLNWGPDGYNVGLDNITFDVRALSGTAVPEPANWTMMILGFGAAGSLIRRRRAKRAPSY